MIIKLQFKILRGNQPVILDGQVHLRLTADHVRQINH